jgi:hypothetical protein
MGRPQSTRYINHIRTDNAQCASSLPHDALRRGRRRIQTDAQRVTKRVRGAAGPHGPFPVGCLI